MKSKSMAEQIYSFRKFILTIGPIQIPVQQLLFPV
jgi:hypothetical protein